MVEWFSAEELGDDAPHELAGVLELGPLLELHLYRVEGRTAGAWFDASGRLLSVVAAGET